ncbi:hypothetical protein P8C59_009477 [Phyllachora maydis]|uniref:Uncharacterized protein n=1 Tax=Phyllachora maydis TaxID=1825666 RepID=A0AAD9MII3_9PEZI|nr:hypothetical protein P8C59_009477 [Phyllachora maydis]
MALTTPALLLHILTETPAGLTFLLRPHAHLPGAAASSSSSSSSPSSPARAAAPLLRSHGLLLLLVNVLCAHVLLAAPGGPATARFVTACLALYHLGPICRAAGRVAAGEGRETRVLGGPTVHLVVHVALLVAMLAAAWPLW